MRQAMIFGTAAAAMALSAAAQVPQLQPTPAQELQAMSVICEAARYADRLHTDAACTYFLDKFQKALAASAAPPAPKPEAKPKDK